MTRRLAIALLLACCRAATASAADCASLYQADWVLGDWVTADGATESWLRLGPRTFEGAGASGSDRETLRLVEMSGRVYYIAKIAHNELPVAFALVDCDDARLVFENPAHDFPRRLEYRRTAADAMTVTVGDGRERSFEVSFHKARADAFAVELQRLHPDIYLVRRPEALREPVEPNTVFVVNDDDVVVFDAGGMPIVAERTIALIRTVTDKPVSVLVNSHWHGDHVLGNQVYRAEYPGLRIVAHPETHAAMTGAPMAYVERYGPMLDGLIATWTAQQQSGELTPARAGLLPDMVLMRDEIARVSIVPPDVLVDDLLVLERGSREIHIRHLGRGNTPGDLVMWLPAERVLATGDLVVHPLPYGFGSFPREWIDTLEALAGLDFELLVPGHGEPQRDTAYLRRLQALLHEVRRQVGAAVADGLDLEATRARLGLRAFSDEFAGDDPDRRRKFEQWWISPISRSAWLEARGEPIVQGASDETG